MHELVFSTVDGLDISLDYYLPPSASKDTPVPILIWWHGGGLLMTRLPGILADLASLLSFVRSPAFLDATSSTVDPTRIFVGGSSAGGWLALLAGTGVGFKACGLEPPERPKGICALYPITDFEDPFWTTKHRPVSYFPRVIGREEMEEYLDPERPQVSMSERESSRSFFYHYMVQEGILASLLLEGTGITPKGFSVAPAIRSGEFTAPPTFIAHGTSDDKVPIRQSQEVVAALEAKGVECEFELREGDDHSFDQLDPSVKLERMYAFIAEYV